MVDFICGVLGSQAKKIENSLFNVVIRVVDAWLNAFNLKMSSKNDSVEKESLNFMVKIISES